MPRNPKAKARPRRKSGRRPSRSSAKTYILTSLLLIASALVVTVAALAWKASRAGLAEPQAVGPRPSPLPSLADEFTSGQEALALGGESRDAQGPLRASDAPTRSPRPPSPSPALKRPASLSLGEGGGHERPGPERGSLVIVIDDVGMNLEQLEPFLRFPGPITFAILPGLPYSRAAAQRIGAAGKELILHQPMEAEGGQNMGPGGILGSMNEFEVLAVLSSNIAGLPGARGINNHMGSAGTQDLALMRSIMGFTRDRGLYFLDSRTTSKTLGVQAAAAENAEIWERDVFLDNESDRESQERMIREGMGIAEKKGRAVMIGHVWSSELAGLLMDMYPELVAEGYSLSSISRLMRGLDDAGPGD